MVEITNLEDIGSLKTGTVVKQNYGARSEGKFDCTPFGGEKGQICRDLQADLCNEAKNLVFKEVVGV